MKQLELSQSKKDISRLLELGMIDKAEEYLALCFELHGKEEELLLLRDKLLVRRLPIINILCFYDTEEEFEQMRSGVNYPKCVFTGIATDGNRLLDRIWEAVQTSEAEYIGFREKNCNYHSDKTPDMIRFMEDNSQLDMATCLVKLVEDEAGKQVVCNYDHVLSEIFDVPFIEGDVLLDCCINNQMNLFGVLSCYVIRRQALIGKVRLLEDFEAEGEYFPFSFECLYGLKVGQVKRELVALRLRRLNKDLLARKERVYFDVLDNISRQGKLNISKELHTSTIHSRLIKVKNNKSRSDSMQIKKEITFFYTDKGEYYNVEPIANGAKKRGYQVIFTTDRKQTAEIGVYCQHECHPGKSKVSLILLHDMAQGHNRWPDIWNMERWNNFDAAVLPGKIWADRWAKCAVQYYANPRRGVFLLGYPKGDIYEDLNLLERVKEIRESKNFKYPISVLYAPSWEYGDKEDDFVLALQSLKVNLLIKQASWEPTYDHIIKNICDMREKHEGKYANVYFIEPEESIMVALHLCDIVVSDESSVMTEALLLNKPGIAVKDWLIPDVNPPRNAFFPGDFVYKCKKVQLRETVEQLIVQMNRENILYIEDNFFSNKGRCNRDILDLIEYLTGERKEADCLKFEIAPEFMPYTLWGN